MLLPMMFPVPIPKFPSLNASEVTTSSGSEVPNATIVRPMKVAEIPMRDAIPSAPSTVRSAPLRSRTRPTEKRMSAMITWHSPLRAWMRYGWRYPCSLVVTRGIPFPHHCLFPGIIGSPHHPVLLRSPWN
ncbi:MAG: hypothetical protein A4E38_00730 [Methanoregulaceae archaeon PtaB.Bin108]|nr:MAG: hypothetical protein A4E38_00730 [Methanoregulaceae archaeon PtaB.Bin108]